MHALDGLQLVPGVPVPVPIASVDFARNRTLPHIPGRFTLLASADTKI